MNITEQSLLPELKRAIEIALQKEIEIAVKETTERIESRVRASLGRMVVGLFSDYRIIRNEQNLVITVKIGEPK